MADQELGERSEPLFQRLGEIEVPPDEPFANDRLGRKDDAEFLTAIVGTAAEPTVITVDAPWGGGKTTFLRMWRTHISAHGHPTVLFNAWHSDFVDDPLVAFVAEIERQLKPSDATEAVSARWKKVRSIGAGMLRATGPLAIRLATQGLLNTEDVKRALSALGDTSEIAGLAEELAETRLRAFEAEKNGVDQFRRTLESFTRALGEGGDPKLPLVVFVDELDRCRPNFAVVLLERVKHLFDVPGIVFVLAMDRGQLAHTIRAVYGSGFDADGYLRRFVDLDYILPAPSGTDFVKHLANEAGLKQVYDANSASRGELSVVVPLFGDLAAAMALSLRDQKQAFQRLMVALRAAPDGRHYLFTHLAVFMVLARIATPELYRRFLKGEATPRDMLEYIRRLPGGEALADTHPVRVLYAYLVLADQTEGKQTLKALQAASADEESTERAWAADILDFVRALVREGGDYAIGELLKRVEMVHQRVRT